MAAIVSEPVKSLCGDENAIEKFMGKRKYGEEENSNSDDHECSDICGCGCYVKLKEDFKFPMFIGKYQNYVFTSIEPYVKEVMKTVSDSNVVLVTELLRETTDGDLLDLFQPYGNVTSAKVARCPHTGLTGGFGFVYFDNRNDARRAIHKLDQTIPNHIDSIIGVEWAPDTPITMTTTT